MIKVGSIVKLFSPPLGYEILLDYIGIVESMRMSYTKPPRTIYAIRFVDSGSHFMLSLLGGISEVP